VPSGLEPRRWSATDGGLLVAGRAGLVVLLIGTLAACGADRPPTAAGLAAAPERLSQWGLFEDPPAAQRPSSDVVPYDINTPLFSDYAEKLRFVRLPPGERAQYRVEGAFELPVGTVIVKTFAYRHDRRDPQAGRRILETRLLVHEEPGWIGLPYVWNEEQTEATLSIAGARLEASWIDDDGELRRHDSYLVPNANQCKGCHRPHGRRMSPVGVRAAELNRDHAYAGGVENQLAHWTRTGMLEGAPSDPEQAPRMAVWDDPTSGSLDARARAWLDINCAHCHNPGGPARTSGLDLSWRQRDPTLLGVFKYPVAAGRGSGDALFGIVPGHPERSILMVRLRSLDPGVMMPELGRSLVHEEGVALIEEWIAAMPDPRAAGG
jgi:uncharacterized repeat protein (TIGR03806 family)